MSNRGTGQGDVDAPAEASIVQVEVAVGTQSEVKSPLLDVWYLNNGNTITHPCRARTYLHAFARESAKVGVERNKEKTRVLLYCAGGRRTLTPDEEVEWNLNAFRQEAEVLVSPDHSIVLGAVKGQGQQVIDQVFAKINIVEHKLNQIRLCCDTQIEFLLQRAYRGLSKITHLLRINGMTIDGDVAVAAAFDRIQQQSLREMIPGLTRFGVEQSHLPIALGGMGLISAQIVALTAFPVTAAPKVHDLSIRQNG